MLAAWNERIGSSPNGLADRDAAREAIGLEPEAEIAIVLSFGYPARMRDPSERSVDEWSSRANRKPLDEVVRRV
jgi:hypothetical protein